MGTEYRYKSDVLEQLALHGVHPRNSTPPAMVREFVNDLYRYELRRLRDRLIGREIAKPDYYAHVVAVRNRYRLLSLKLWQWTDSQESAQESGPRTQDSGRGG